LVIWAFALLASKANNTTGKIFHLVIFSTPLSGHAPRLF
jgi:hypothetical protein